MAILNQFTLLIWKNFLIQKRSIKWTVAEILVPLFLLSLLMLMNLIGPVNEHSKKVTLYGPQMTTLGLDDLNKDRNQQCRNRRNFSVDTIFYAPNDTKTKALMKNMLFFMNIGFESEEDLLKELKQNYSHSCDISQYCRCFSNVVGAVIFDQIDDSTANLKYRIRLANANWINGSPRWGYDRTIAAWNTRIQWKYRGFIDTLYRRPSERYVYWLSGFLTVQHAVDTAAVKLFSTSSEHISMSTNMFPKTEQLFGRGEKTRFQISSIAAKFQLDLIFVVLLLFIIRNLIYEKERGLREYMKVMGLGNFQQWLSHFIWNLLKMIILSFFFTLATQVHINGRAVFYYSDPTIIFVFMLLLCCSLICYAFTISVFFQTAAPAMTIGTLFYLVASYMSYIAILAGWLDSRQNWFKYNPLTFGQCLGYTILMFFTSAFGFDLIKGFETEGAGMQWKYLFTPINSDSNITMGFIMIMLIVDMIICIIITWYFDAINPGTQGQSQKFWFPFQISYWKGYSKDLNIERKHSIKGDKTKREEEPDRRATISINGLVKTFKRGTIRALDGVNLKIYSNEITALLGHNGAGKTTTMKILTGLLSSESGYVTIAGYDLKKSLVAIRQKLGLCPQDNILFDMLTVEEHLKLFCRLKGRPIDEVEIYEMCSSLDIYDKMKAKVTTLSGGMKRKLLVAIALIGHSEIVILDEPTSGIDPLSRRKIWEFLKMQKLNRTIILSTHYMDEADILGDRIAILANGRLQCYGSSLFLKKHYGAGYNLTVVFEHDQQNRTRVLELIRGHCRDAQMQPSPGTLEATYVLPVRYKAEFADLFSELEAKQNYLKISTFGVSLTTMEDVFLKVGEIAEEDEQQLDRSSLVSIEGELHLSHNFGLKPLDLNEGPLLWFQRFCGMLIKRFHYFKRSWRILIPQFIMPLLFAAVCIAIVKSVNSRPSRDESYEQTVNMPPLELSLKSFGKTVTPIISNVNGTPVQNIVDMFKKLTTTKEVTSITNFTINEYAENNQFDVEHTYVVGAQFEEEKLTTFYQANALHSEPISINMLDNAILRSKTPNKEAWITVINHPLPSEIFSKPSKPTYAYDGLPNEYHHEKEQTTYMNPTNIVCSIFLPFGLGFLIASFVLFIVKENVTNAKHLQILTGTHPIIYWTSSFVWDYTIYMITVTIIYILLVSFKIYEHELFGLFVAFCLYGFAAIPRIYLLGFLFSSPNKAFALSIALCSVFGTMITLGLLGVADEKSRPKLNAMIPFGLPSYGFGQVLLGEKLKNLILPLFGAACLYWIVITLIELDLFKKTYAIIKNLLCPWRHSNVVGPVHAVVVDPDVETENENVQNLTIYAPLIVNRLTKNFGTLLAVNSLSFHVEEYDCFGLLGVNGAGKTTTFEMLVGKHNITAGKATVSGKDVGKNWRRAGTNIGYCPQFDALISRLTAQETLALFARLRGCPEKEIKRLVNAAIKYVGIDHYSNKIVKTYSGGIKRRLSVGIALVCLPSVLILDEPTSGIDPAGRRRIWEILTQLRRHGLAILMSSHCMDECEALCTKIAVMVKGQLICIGSPQYLKTKFGMGYTLQVKIGKNGQIERAQKLLIQAFPGSVLKEVNESILHYEVPSTETTTWSSLFINVANLVEPLNIVDYSLSQTTLEQIFHNLSKESV